MKKILFFAAIVLSAHMAESADSSEGSYCSRDLKAVEAKERTSPACKAQFIKNIWSKYGNKTLRGTGMASSYSIKFLNPANGFKLVYNGQQISGTVCCIQGRWQMQNSQGVQSLKLVDDGVMIAGYKFVPMATGNISNVAESDTGGSLGWDSQFSSGSSGARSSRGRN